jgi:glucuronoarabinoxylan endo-1,4-beta-xylanase
MRCRISVVSATLVAALAATTVAQVTVGIRPDSVYQTIEGFGAHGSLNVWWSDGPFYNDQFLNLVVDDLGLTMNRNEFYPDYESTNDNNDPNTLGTFNTNGIFVNKQRGWINALKNKAAQSGEPIRFIASYWSPPSWMKQNNSTVGGDAATNILRTGVENELGEFGVATVKAYKDQCNVDLYALSMQNEPAFDEPYNSCVYTPTRYRDVFKVFASRVHAVYPNVKLFGAEHMLINWGTFEGQLNTDSTARAHINAFAVHGYSDGVHPTASSQAVQKWKQAGNNVFPTGKGLWMTETSGYSDTWTDAFHLAEMIYAGLRHGKMSAWVWWQLSENTSNSVYVFMYNGNPTKRYYVHKQFYRYIRPDAVMIGAPVSGDTLTFVTAFHHRQNQTLSVVLLNANTSSRTVTLSGTELPTFQVYRTSGSENCVNAGTATGSVTLPANSITTLYGTGYNPSTPVIDPISGRVNPAALASMGSARVYTLDGKMVRAIQDARITDGRVRWDGRDEQGRQLSRGAYFARLVDGTGAVRGNRLPVDIR